jgi:hypothetical protein
MLFSVPGLYFKNYNPTIISIVGLAQLIISRCLRNCSVLGRGKEFISSNAQNVFGAQSASHSIDIRSSFLGIRRWVEKFTPHPYSLFFHSVHPVTNLTLHKSRSVYIPYIT